MNRPVEPHEQAQYDQDQAEINHLIAHAREHRLEFCSYRDHNNCVGVALSDYLHDLSTHDLIVISVSCLARLADLPAPDAIEGIGPL